MLWEIKSYRLYHALFIKKNTCSVVSRGISDLDELGLPFNPPGGGGGHSGMVWLSCAAPPWGAVAVQWTLRVK